MILSYYSLSRNPKVFLKMTGLHIPEFDELVNDLAEPFAQAEEQRLSRKDRRRAIGAGHPYELTFRDQILLAVIWLRLYPQHEVLAFLFGVSDSTVSRIIARFLPLLEQAGKDTMRLPDPGKKRRPSLDELLKDTPELAVLIDTFEQKVQRPLERAEADRHYSGKKRQHTLKSQVAVHEDTGEIVDVAESEKGRQADITILKNSKLLARLPNGVGGIGDLGYLGMDKIEPAVPTATPRKKPRGQARPAEDVAYNRAFSRRRIKVENTIGRMRRYQCLSQTDRNHRQLHTERTRAVAGLVNRQIRRTLPR